jgi:hypothetical protein
MLEKLKKHSVKIFVFTINILLAAIAVLIIREKDQARLLEGSPKEVPIGGNAQNIPLPSFEDSVSTESVKSDSVQADAPVGNSTTIPAVPIPVPTPTPTVVAPPSSSSVSTPAPAPAANPSNAKTKTS